MFDNEIIENSILLCTKKNIGVSPDDTAFDTEIITDINTILMIANEFGVGNGTIKRINSDAETWSDFMGDQMGDMEAIKTYVHLRVKHIFDPPSSSVVMECENKIIDEIEVRLYEKAEQSRAKEGV